MRVIVILSLACLTLSALVDPVVTAQTIDWEDCASCHDTEAVSLPQLSTFRLSQIPQQRVDCLECHRRDEVSRVGGSWTHPVRPVGAHIGCTMCHPAVSHDSGTPPPLPSGDYNHEGCFACHRDIEAKLGLGGDHSAIVTCRECHPPHSQMDAALPITVVPTDMRQSAAPSYDWYTSNQSCLQCHGTALLMTSLQGGFTTLNTENYHDIHVVRGRILCVECHDPHGSLYAPMMRSELLTGEIMLYMPAPDGGTCAVICHSVDHDNWRYINDVY